MSSTSHEYHDAHQECLSRRAFLRGGGAAVGGVILLTGIPGMGGRAIAAETVSYPRALIGKLSELETNKPMAFNYPDKNKNSNSVLVKLGTPAGGGIGTGRDVVAFNTLCTHMGGDLGKSFQPMHQALGPCQFHQSTFDLTRHGIIISGHGTESLPQVLLETENDNIYAVGMLGLIYGRYDNLKG
ncbi:MAG: arsenite oxidase small subunit [Rhodospirillales bacterium RIFCSPLOWO2_12_FULL_58_28]|nr:MAG: arsenite oxidase small subunit [Rhodospirillales bacterium RIFCSPLOWO2_02_FULL_58_16]OHC76877.1 MAG: arsenite oxidase small subunit [Rhodospirillales bacterium RIFCSPLOWO2_12_FULL_58_28]